MGRVYALTSGKGGVGKSTVAVGLGLAFSEMAKRVLLVDMDAGLRCLDLMLGVEQKTVFDFGDAIISGDPESATYTVPGRENLFLIPASLKATPIHSDSFEKLAGKLCEAYDVTIFDFPAGVDFSLYASLPDKTLFLTVATPDPVSVRDAAAVGEKLEELSRPSRLIINRFDYALAKRGVFYHVDDVIDGAGLRLAGIVPTARELALLQITGKLSGKGKPMAAFRRIAKRLAGEDVGLPRLKKI